jgi:hypothetical protein
MRQLSGMTKACPSCSRTQAISSDVTVSGCVGSLTRRRPVSVRLWVLRRIASHSGSYSSRASLLRSSTGMCTIDKYWRRGRHLSKDRNCVMRSVRSGPAHGSVDSGERNVVVAFASVVSSRRDSTSLSSTFSATAGNTLDVEETATCDGTKLETELDTATAATLFCVLCWTVALNLTWRCAANHHFGCNSSSSSLLGGLPREFCCTSSRKKGFCRKSVSVSPARSGEETM